jgi:hypothetical protein
MDKRLRNHLHPKKTGISEYVSQAEFARMLGVCIPTFLKYERLGKIPAPNGIGHKKLKQWLRTSALEFIRSL